LRRSRHTARHFETFPDPAAEARQRERRQQIKRQHRARRDQQNGSGKVQEPQQQVGRYPPGRAAQLDRIPPVVSETVHRESRAGAQNQQSGASDFRPGYRLGAHPLPGEHQDENGKGERREPEQLKRQIRQIRARVPEQILR
jgi:hypothetical protein